MKPIRILQVVPNMQQGGIENFIMNVYRNIDRSKVQFDFLVHYSKESFFDKEIENLGGKIYRFTIREDYNLFKYIKELNKFFREHKEYKVVHGHMASLGFIYLGIAKKHGINVRIAHSHGTSYLKNLKGYIKYLAFKLIKYKANVRFACSKEAGEYLFGKKDFEIVQNAIDIEKFIFNEDIRKEVRKELEIENKFVIGHIGRFNMQKNHEFLIQIFDCLQQQESNAVLLLVGTGELENVIKQKVSKLNLTDKVMFLGVRKDAEKLYQAMDMFVMPSLFEGLPVTAIEAQASGLPCILSDSISREAQITNLVKFISLEQNEKEWGNLILASKEIIRKSDIKELSESEYNIKKITSKLENKYIELNNV